MRGLHAEERHRDVRGNAQAVERLAEIAVQAARNVDRHDLHRMVVERDHHFARGAFERPGQARAEQSVDDDFGAIQRRGHERDHLVGPLRSLGRRGIPVWFLTDDKIVAKFSCYTAHALYWPGPEATDAAEFLNQLAHEDIVAAIRTAEQKTSGEIRVFISRKKIADPVAAAQAQFERLGMTRTRNRNGVLIYVAPAARKFAIHSPQRSPSCSINSANGGNCACRWPSSGQPSFSRTAG